ncbi:TPA: hypothetical protein QCK10_001506 [Enterobacter roggenkampii]|nr:hypothetical protein [Enterobacter roggenkampii]
MDHKLLQELTQAVEKATSEVLEKNNLPYASVSCHWQIPGLDKFGSIFAVSGTQEIAKPAGSGGSGRSNHEDDGSSGGRIEFQYKGR